MPSVALWWNSYYYMKRKILGIVSLIISVGLIVWLLSRIDTARASQIIKQANSSYLLAACGLILINPLLMVLRWRGVLSAQAGDLVPFMVSLRAVLMANVLNSFLPSKAGDMAKAVYLRKHGGLSRGLGTVVLERMIDFCVLGSLGIIGFFISGVNWGLLAGTLMIGGMAFLFCFITFFPLQKVGAPEKVLKIASDFQSVWKNWITKPASIAQTLLGSIGVWSICGMIVFLLSSAFEQSLDVAYAYSIFPLAVLAGLVPTTISGIGTRDAAFVALLSAYMPTEEATLIGLGYTLIAYWLLSLISLPVVFIEIVEFFKRGTVKDER